jgi:hypothetical protein
MDASVDPKQVKRQRLHAQRHKRVARRRKLGLRCYDVEVHEQSTIEFLIEAHQLHPDQADDPDKVAEAIGRFVTLIVKAKDTE